MAVKLALRDDLAVSAVSYDDTAARKLEAILANAHFDE
jgi:hypothetical protein